MLTAQVLRSLVSYDAATGEFRWLPRPKESFASSRAATIWHRRYCDRRAGGENRIVGYSAIRILGRAHWSHRLAWLYVTGAWPQSEIDHINGDRFDNRFANLRDVARLSNAQNVRRAPRKASGLPLGVFFNARKIQRPFSASIRVNGRSKHLGYFDTSADAHAAYVSEKRRVHVGCTI